MSRLLGCGKTSFDELSTLFGQIGRDVVLVVDKLLETDPRQQSRAQREVSGQTQSQNGRGKVNVETVRDDRKDIHMTHNLEKSKV